MLIVLISIKRPKQLLEAELASLPRLLTPLSREMRKTPGERRRKDFFPVLLGSARITTRIEYSLLQSLC